MIENRIDKNRKKKSQKKTEAGIIKVLFEYLRGHLLTVIIYLMFIVVFGTIFFLYRVETEAVLYGAGLCLLLLVVILPIHFIRYYLKHRELRDLSEKKYLSSGQIPEGSDLIEQDYRELLLEWIENTAKETSNLRIFKEESMEYYSTWVHQIKTPIAVMRLLLQEEDTEKNQKLLMELFRIEQYVDMVLSYFRLDSTEKDLVVREYPLDEIIRSCIRKYASWFVMKGLNVHYEGTDQKVLTDKKWLTFMTEQILSNAIKYTEEGIITIKVLEGPVLSIEDTGIGIAPEDLPRIFEKGFTGYNGRADKKSTGIGLYLVKRTVDLMGTPVNVTSTPGQGSRFTIDLTKKYMELE